MEFSFWGLNIWQLLTIGLIGLLFIKEVVVDFVRNYFGLSTANEDGMTLEAHGKQISALERHAEVANDEMGRMEERMGRVENKLDTVAEDTAFLRGKLS